MAGENVRRPRRNPLSPEEVAEIVALKKRMAHYQLHKFKKTSFYKLINIFNVACFFIYLEVLFCYAGPGRYESHRAVRVEPHYSERYNQEGRQRLDDVELLTESGKKYVFVIREFIEVPPHDAQFFVGSDFLLGKELKGFFENDEKTYRLFAGSHLLVLSALILVASFIAYLYNLNENAYSLSAMGVLNGLTLLAILFF